MDNKEILKMLKEEVERKADAETIEKLKNAGSANEAISILKSASVELDEDMLTAVAGGEKKNPWGMPIPECEFLHRDDPTPSPSCSSFIMI